MYIFDRSIFLFQSSNLLWKLHYFLLKFAVIFVFGTHFLRFGIIDEILPFAILFLQALYSVSHEFKLLVLNFIFVWVLELIDESICLLEILLERSCQLK